MLTAAAALITTAITVVAGSPSSPSSSSDNVPLELISWGTPLNQELHIPFNQHDPGTTNPSFVLLLVNHVPWTTHPKRESGRFSVRAPRAHGLMAVIQIVNLRKSSSGVDQFGACRDYIKLSDPSGLLTSTPQICGVLKESRSFTPDTLVGPRVFHSASGRMDVYYESDGEALPQDESPSYPQTNQVVEIVFTGYTDCLIDSFEEQLKCGDKCISASLSCDTQLNCGFQEDFATDEHNCTYTNSRRHGLAGDGGGGGAMNGSRSSYLVSLYLGAVVFLVMLVAVAFYHRHATYMRIKNIPT